MAPRPGQLRYSEREIELIRAVAAKRAAGLVFPVAIDQAQSEGSQPAPSVYAALRRRRPDHEPRVLLKPMMLALSHAIEDEALAKAERLMVYGSFQRERFYRKRTALVQQVSDAVDDGVRDDLPPSPHTPAACRSRTG